jgi:large conductance mechanosensitive channel
MLKEFRDFVLRGNVIDLAIGVIIGAAFGTIVKSLVDDIIMPPIGMLLGGVDFSNLFIALDGSEHASLAAAKEAGAPAIAYGAFINTVISFIIVAFAIFITIKQVNKLFMKKKEAPPPAAKPRQEELLEQIRDALVARKM